jgi:hypothetical protein
MPLLALPAVFMRGGTSRAIMFHRRDLPDRTAWDPIFLAAMGSPDPNGRQLNGMGGGISSLSKVCILAPSERADADIDYTFAQVQIREAAVDYRSNCGNMSSAVGPFAIDEGLLRANGDTAVVRIFNTNTGKLIRATFPLRNGRAAVDGDLEIPGVAGTGAPIRLDFLSPGGAATGKLLPTGNVSDRLDIPGMGRIEVSMVDAANPCVFVRARDLGLIGTELPDALDANPALLERLQHPPRRRSRHGHRAGRRLGPPQRRHPLHRLHRPADGRAHPVRRAHRPGPHRPDRAIPVQRPAPSRFAADRLTLYRCRRPHRGHVAVPGTGHPAFGRRSHRHAVRHPDRRRRRVSIGQRPVDRPQRRLLPYCPPPVRRAYLRPARLIGPRGYHRPQPPSPAAIIPRSRHRPPASLP